LFRPFRGSGRIDRIMAGQNHKSGDSTADGEYERRWEEIKSIDYKDDSEGCFVSLIQG